MAPETIANIQNMQAYGLCNRCGTCAGICPNGNIEAVRLESGDYRFLITDNKKCQKCSGICYKACPGHEVDFDYFNKKYFGKIPESYAVGNYISSYVASARDEEIAKAAASGGMATQLLLHALQTKRIDGVLSVSVGGETGMTPQFYIAETKEELLKAAQSKYYPIPKNIALRDVLQDKRRFAVVGIPCQIHGLRKAQEIDKRLRERIVFCIGLYCGRTPSLRAAGFIMRRAGYDPQRVSEMRHRQGKPYPGKYYLKLKSGEEVCLDDKFKLPGFGGLLFMDSSRCTLCPDRLNELSDISVGDNAAFPGEDAPKGPSSVIVRSAMCQEMMDELLREDKIVAVKAGIAECIEYQRQGLINKKGDTPPVSP